MSNQISVDAAALHRAAGQLKQMPSDTRKRGEDIKRSLHKLRMNTRRGDEFRRRMSSCADSLSAQAQEAEERRTFLTWVSDRYIQADDSLVKRADPLKAAAPKEQNRRIDKQSIKDAFKKSFKAVINGVKDVSEWGVDLVTQVFHQGHKIVKYIAKNHKSWARYIPTFVRFGKFIPIIGLMLDVIDIGFVADEEYLTSSGSTARRVSNAIVVGASVLAFSIALGALATAVAGPGILVGLAVGTVASAAATELGRAYANHHGESSLKNRIGDKVEDAVYSLDDRLEDRDIGGGLSTGPVRPIQVEPICSPKSMAPREVSNVLCQRGPAVQYAQ